MLLAMFLSGVLLYVIGSLLERRELEKRDRESQRLLDKRYGRSK